MIFRPEHPKPQFMRESWCNLNGSWSFHVDSNEDEATRGAVGQPLSFDSKIQVPFCPESSLSGIGRSNFMKSVWYQRSFAISREQRNGRMRLHFGAVDYEAIVYINGKCCGTHRGGYVSFSFDVTDYIVVGENNVTVHVLDDTTDRLIPSGKQSSKPESYECYYTRTTGIWQTVWLEFMPDNYIAGVKYYTDPENDLLTIHATLQGEGTFRAEAFFEGKPVGTGEVFSQGGTAILAVPLSEKHLWEVGKGNLYDLKLTFGDDRVQSYFGLRSLRLDGHRFLINEKPIFQRLVLDQGFYPDGIYTAPSDSELIADIERSLAMGFNGARLHEKIFEERFLYHCDRLGYIVWGEYPNWGLNHTYADSIYGILPEWLEEIDRDFNHPAIIGWCPFNETWDIDGKQQHDPLLSTVYLATKAADPTRPCIDTSGNMHVLTDIYDLHDYTQNVEEFRKNYEPLGKSNFFDFPSALAKRQQYDGISPFFVSEYGGIRWTEDQSGWGYGDAPKTPQEYLERLKGLTDVLLDNPLMFGLCYTQLTDVEQEQNGLYTYDRQAKFPPEEIYKIFSRKAAFEET